MIHPTARNDTLVGAEKKRLFCIIFVLFLEDAFDFFDDLG